MVGWTAERIAALSPSDRSQIYVNAKRLNTPDARRLVELIESAGLPFSEGGSVKRDDPLSQAIFAIVDSKEGRDACVKAVKAGLPALAGVDSLLARKFGADYGKHNMTTNWAGLFVAEIMRDIGYRQVGKMGSTPAGCVAQSGEMYEPK